MFLLYFTAVAAADVRNILVLSNASFNRPCFLPSSMRSMRVDTPRVERKQASVDTRALNREKRRLQVLKQYLDSSGCRLGS
jgi:hypothetical protein